MSRLAEAMMPAAFDGSTYDPKRDGARLKNQLGRVYRVLSDGKWRTLREIANEAGCPEASASARFRELGQEGFITDKKHTKGGLWIYRMVTS